MKISIGLNDRARLDAGQILNQLLADESVLYGTTRDYHWNVTGPEFRSLRQDFEEQYQQIAQWIGDVAERTRAIAVGVRGNWAELTNAARFSATPGVDLVAEDMLIELVTLHEKLIMQLRSDSETCRERLRDAGTADFLTSLMMRHEKMAWMLRAQRETQEVRNHLISFKPLLHA